LPGNRSSLPREVDGILPGFLPERKPLISSPRTGYSAFHLVGKQVFSFRRQSEWRPFFFQGRRTFPVGRSIEGGSLSFCVGLFFDRTSFPASLSNLRVVRFVMEFFSPSFFAVPYSFSFLVFGSRSVGKSCVPRFPPPPLLCVRLPTLVPQPQCPVFFPDSRIGHLFVFFFFLGPTPSETCWIAMWRGGVFFFFFVLEAPFIFPVVDRVLSGPPFCWGLLATLASKRNPLATRSFLGMFFSTYHCFFSSLGSLVLVMFQDFPPFFLS